MFSNPSLITRIAIGKGVGFLVGLIGFVSVPFFLPEPSWLLRWGILLWYTTVGAVIGVYGVFTWHPILKMPMPWWIRSTIIGAWMNFVLTFFAYDDMQDIMVHDVSGRLVQSNIGVDANTFYLNRGNLPPGMYVVRIRFEEGIVAKKIIFNQ